MGSRNIEISVRGASEEDLANSRVMRFVVTDNAETRNVVLGRGETNASLNHAALVPPNTELVGGGVTEAFESGFLAVQWGSGSCDKEFGYDRPADEDTAEQVLTEIKSVIRAWRKRVLNI